VRIVTLLLILLALAYTCWFYPKVWIAIFACMVPAFLIAMIHGERINIFSGRKLGLITAAKGNALALVGAFLVPGRVTEILKPWYFYKTRHLPMPAGVSVLVVERIFDVIAVTGLSVVAIYFIALPPSNLDSLISNLVLVVAIVLLLVLVLTLRFPILVERLIGRLPFESVRKFIQSTFLSFRENMAYGLGYWSILLTISVWAGSVGLYWLFLQYDGGVNLDFTQSLVVFLIGTLGITITITPGGLGTFEAAVTIILQQYGYDFEAALASAIGLRLVAFFPNAIIVSYVVLYEGIDFVRARREAEELGAGNDNP